MSDQRLFIVRMERNYNGVTWIESKGFFALDAQGAMNQAQSNQDPMQYSGTKRILSVVAPIIKPPPVIDGDIEGNAQ